MRRWARSVVLATTALGGAAHAAATPGSVEEVVVTATRSERKLLDVPASVAVQSLDDLRRLGFTTGTDEFRGVPGVSLRRGEGGSDDLPFVSIRGSTGVDGYLTMVDGAPFFGPDDEPLLTQVPYAALERIEIVKGPTSTLYGRGGLYGTVNYLTRSPRTSDVSLSASVGSDAYVRGEAELSRRFDWGGALVVAAYQHDGGWREQSRRQVWNLFAKAEADLSAKTTLSASLNLSDRDAEAPNALPLDASGQPLDVIGGAKTFLGFGSPRNRTKGVIAQARLAHEATDALRFTATLQGRSFEQDLRLNFFDPFGVDPARHVVSFNGFGSQGRHKVLFGEATAEWRSGAHTVLAGVSGEASEARSVDTWSGQNGFTAACGFAFYLVEIDYSTGKVLNARHPCFVVDEPLTRDQFKDGFVGAFIQDELALGSRWRLTVGLRYDAFTRRARVASPPSAPSSRLEGDADAFSPKAALSYRFAGGQAYLAYGRGFSSNFGPTFEWNAALYARPTNKPSTLDSYEVGAKGRLLDGTLQYEAALFHTEQRHRRQSLPNPAAETDVTAPSSSLSSAPSTAAAGRSWRSPGGPRRRRGSPPSTVGSTRCGRTTSSRPLPDRWICQGRPRAGWPGTSSISPPNSGSRPG